MHTADKSRPSRDEVRLFEVFAPGDSLADTEWADHIRAIIRALHTLTRSAATGLWRAATDTALFISDIVLAAAVCAKIVRDLWSIENRSPYVRDGSFAEDASRIRCNSGIFACLRSFATNILRFNRVRNVSDGRHRLRRHQHKSSPLRVMLSVEQPRPDDDEQLAALERRPFDI